MKVDREHHAWKLKPPNSENAQPNLEQQFCKSLIIFRIISVGFSHGFLEIQPYPPNTGPFRQGTPGIGRLQPVAQTIQRVATPGAEGESPG